MDDLKSVRFQGGYAVGNCKPPVHCQFKKGVSGNPKGKPVGLVSLKTVIRRELQNRDAKALVERIFRQAMNGDLECLEIIFMALEGKQSKRIKAKNTKIRKGKNK